MKKSICSHVIKATHDDSRDIWLWRNDPITREMSITTDEVSWDSHSQWFGKVLENNDRHLFIGLDDLNNKLGMCRFDKMDNGYEVSINLNPQFRGKKISTTLLSKAINAMKNIIENQRTNFYATIKSTNLTSRKCFFNCGFGLVGFKDDYEFYKLNDGAMLKNEIEEKLKIIDDIEQIRKNNNVNWMDLLRLAYKVAPSETKKLIRKINDDDNRISILFAKLGD